MKQFEVYGKLISDCSVIVEADTEEEAINVANNIDWDEWDYVEANTLDVDSVREYIVELSQSRSNIVRSLYFQPKISTEVTKS